MKFGAFKGGNVTLQYSQTAWIDVLYTSVLNTPGKVEDAARFLTERRGVRITGESLRLRLREVDGARLSGEMFELLVEWMLEKNQAHALDAVHAFIARFGLVASTTGGGGGTECVRALVDSVLTVSSRSGALAEEVRRAADDGVIEGREAEAIEKVGRAAQRQIEETIQIARRANRARRKALRRGE
ncbi:phage regulatory CII family protein [Burkholderia vietnamiensis]|uniref:phage regulatory CII family protein n=1 Tax=Burkholderia vietnamiensis TaxID=60552 RepID=UPI000842105F|nr:phage regulatory CII family protein [Burkholderia vietnamiensis]